MLEGKIKMFKEIEDGYPVFFTRPPKGTLFREDHRIVEIEDLYKHSRINNSIILKGNQAKYYHFFEVHNDKAYTLSAFIDCFFGVGESFEIDDRRVEKDLIRMVNDKKIKGVYYKGHYYFHM